MGKLLSYNNIQPASQSELEEKRSLHQRPILPFIISITLKITFESMSHVFFPHVVTNPECVIQHNSFKGQSILCFAMNMTSFVNGSLAYVSDWLHL